MITLILMGSGITLIIAFFWIIYYSIKKSGREKERLQTLEKANESTAETTAYIIEQRHNSVAATRKQLHKTSRD